MKFILITAIAGLLISGPANAVNCLDSIPPSNPDSVYTSDGSGTVTDSRTGLMWKVCAEGQTWNGGSCSGAESTYTWYAALAWASESIYAGYSDWRLPNLKELRSLVEECRRNPAINDTVFPGASSSTFWSGSPFAGQSNVASFVAFTYGTAGGGARDNSSLSVRLVRGGK